jgi:hypothetical protein
VGRGHRELTKITHGTGRGDRGGGAEEEGSGRKLKKRSTTRGVKTPRTNLGRVASREPRREEEAARAKQASCERRKHTGAGSGSTHALLLPAAAIPLFQLPPLPAARAREEETRRGGERACSPAAAGGSAGERRGELDANSRPRDLTPRRLLSDRARGGGGGLRFSAPGTPR